MIHYNNNKLIIRFIHFLISNLFLIHFDTAVSLVIFIVGKCSQKEWQKGTIGVYQDRFLDDFSLFNCFWFAIGAMLRQNSEISPR